MYYPERALRENMGGDVTMACAIDADGHLSGCQITAEHPQAVGFGENSLRFSRLLRMAARTADGSPTAGASVVIRIDFRPVCDEGAAPPSTDLIVRPSVRDAECGPEDYLVKIPAPRQ